MVCGTILFAKGKPIAGRVTTVLLVPVMVGMLAHLLFGDVVLQQHVIPTLYETGRTLHSGGVIAGGIAAIMEAAISNVGALIISFILFTYLILRLMNIRLKTILEFFIGVHDKAELRRETPDFYDASYEDDEDEVRAAVAPLPAKRPKPQKELPVPKKESEPESPKKSRRSSIDLPLEAEQPVLTENPGAVEQIAFDAAELEKEIVEADHYEAPAAPSLPDTQPLPVIPPVQETPAPAPRSVESAAEPDDDEPPFDLEDEPPFDLEDEPEAALPVTELPRETLPLQPTQEGAEPMVVDTHQINDDAHDESSLVKAQGAARREYDFPPISFLHEEEFAPTDDVTEELRVRSHKLADTLSSFGIQAQIINVIRGPSITRYEILLDRGVKFSRLTSLQDDIALALGASGVRIAAIPDKSAVGIEVPNKVVQTVYMRDVLTSRPMAESKSKLAFALGKDITGTSIIGDIAKMPHMLIAGTTGSGKSVCINSIIVSLLYRASPNEVKLIMIDPKMVELGNYNGIPHLLVPVVTDYKKAAGALNWAVVEMERRYKLMFEYGVRDLDSFNKAAVSRGEDPMPRIVIIIDELADLMMMAAKEIEESICRIAQKARAAGMHLIIATQRPSADVLTGLMKSNIPSRIAFAVASQMESRIILDTGGAEKLIGRGDMLFFPLGMPKPMRVQGCFLSSGEVEEVTEFIKQSGPVEYSNEILDHMERSASSESGGGGDDDEEEDDKLFEAVDVVMQTGQASASMLQRKLKLGYARAARIIDQMESRGIIGPFDGARPRQLLISKADWQEMKSRRSW
ncbi:MAG: DNA translocase FtsK [Ruminococcaceae bacterium]|nr:DNA translocase FtsK [Oscillospiraceae bacterium]